jgi:FKBP-type peptidyl-prolyl cis-trans isomerase SlyD
MLIGPNSVVSFHYRLTNSKGELLDASTEDSPLTYLHGAGNIIPGLEKELLGKSAGASFEVTVAPEEGYGPRRPELVQEVPREAFPEPDQIEPGMRFSAESEQGQLSVVVTSVTDSAITVDANHPLAGEQLHFSVDVASVRDASPEEVSHGHVHGEGGHHH